MDMLVQAENLTKRYGGTWALRECTLAIPGGQVAALVGPNGAGKTTLLNLTVGLGGTGHGGVTAPGDPPAGSQAALDGMLSGGQLAQLALTLALARRPRLLVPDEPTAMLDPIARLLVRASQYARPRRHHQHQTCTAR